MSKQPPEGSSDGQEKRGEEPQNSEEDLTPNAENSPQNPNSEKHDPFDPKSLRLNGADEFTVRKELSIVACRKPNSHAFVRVNPDETSFVETAIFEDKLEQEIYLVDKSLWGSIPQHIKPVCLFTTVDRQGNVFLWPVKLPGQNRPNTWNESSLAAAKLAMSKWIRVESNREVAMYEAHVAQGRIPDPVWPTVPFGELLRLCFQNRLIDSVDHPVLQRLRGQL